MPQDPPLPTEYASYQTESTSFKARLLQAGDSTSAGNELSIDGFNLVRQLFPIEALVYQQAINEVAGRLTDAGSTPDQATAAVNEGRRLLNLTLMPFIDLFVRSTPGPADSSDLEHFRQLAAPWATAQLRSCARYVIILVIHDYVRHLGEGLMTSIEQERIDELNTLIDEHGHRPEAQPLVDKARADLRRLYQAVADRPTVEPLNPRALSYLLTCTKAGHLRDNALAAIVLKGNSSAGAEAVANPLQILEVADVAGLLSMRNDAVTSTVSKIRSKATKHDRIDNSPYELDPRHLWVFVEPTQVAANLGSEGSP
jgi:hypothetical protein